MKTTILVCECHSVEHQVVIQNIDDEYYFNIHLNNRPFWKRIRNAFFYVLGKKNRYGDWAEFIINPDDADKLQEVVNGLKRAQAI